MSDRMNIDELADAAGLTRRAIRYYVQQKLLPTPLGVGRGKHYDATHLARIKRLQELQTAGYSLDAIRQVLDGVEVAAPPANHRRRGRPVTAVELWTRLKVADGLELNFDSRRFNIDAEQLVAARDALRAAFGLTNEKDDSEKDDGKKDNDEEGTKSTEP